MGLRDAVRVLVVDDDRQINQICAHFLTKAGFDVESAFDGAGAIEKIQGSRFAVVLLDVRLPDSNGLDVLRRIKSLHPAAEVILITAHGTVEDAVEGMKAGACDFVAKPFRRERLVAAVEQAARVVSLQSEVGRLQTELSRTHAFEGIVGQSPAMRPLFDKIAHAAQTDATVLILGESGTGKDLVARTIHYNGTRSKGPFVAINCAALPGELIESELFGYRKGAFTGATSDSVGLFRAADGGTVFLDEVAEMPLPTQAKLLRVLQERRVRPVGETGEIPVDVRVICATNRSLAAAVADGEFRKELLYRLTVLTLTLPPLRERRGDIPLLVYHFVRKFNARFHKSIQGVDARAMQALCDARWEGNIRELENVIESGFALGKGPVITPADLPKFLEDASGRGAAEGDGILTLREAEKTLLERALRHARGNKSQAARVLGVTRKRLYSLMRRHKVKR